ncbi:hypothetical protein BH23GEM6_BH23GEM6_00220 [soil metagenome]
MVAKQVLKPPGGQGSNYEIPTVCSGMVSRYARIMAEHSDYHGSFREYVRAKVRFFEYLKPGVPLVYWYDDRGVRGVVRGKDVRPIGVGQSSDAAVQYDSLEMDASGSRFRLHSSRPLPLLSGGERDPFHIPISLRALGRSMVENAALAATAALVAGADEESVQRALVAFPPPRRRMQVLLTEPFLVLDDTAGHPDSIGVAFEVVQRLARERVHILIAIRGKRGVKINRRTAEAFAIWTGKTPLTTLIVTSSRGAADSLNAVSARERTAFLGELEKAGVQFEERERLDDAMDLLLSRARTGDLVSLLGAQGMDQGGSILEQRLASSGG